MDGKWQGVMKLVRMMLLPYFKRFWLMLLSVIIVGAFGSGMLIGLRNAYLSLETDINKYISECNYPDLQAGLNKPQSYVLLAFLPENYTEDFDIEYISFRENEPVVFSDQNGKSFSGRAFTEGFEEYYVPDSDGNKTYFSDSFLSFYSLSHYDVPEDEIPVKMESIFAATNGFKAGDKITVSLDKDIEMTWTISDLVSSPETCMVQADVYAISSSRDFAYLYVPYTALNALYPDRIKDIPMFNELLIKFKDGKERSIDEFAFAMNDAVNERFPWLDFDITESMSYALTYKDAPVIHHYDSMLHAIDKVSLYVPIMFFAIVLIVTILFLTQIIRQCRKDIGIMRALGESVLDITMLFMGLALVISVVAWILGLGVGAIIQLLADNAYASALRFPEISFNYNWLNPLYALLALVAVTEITALYISAGISRIKPTESMKALPPSNNQTPYLTRTLFRNAPIPIKVSVSQNIRNLQRYIISGICIFVSGLLIMTAVSLGESKLTVVKQYFDVRMNDDVQVYLNYLPSDLDAYYLKAGIKDENGNLSPLIDDIQLLKYQPFSVRHGDKNTIVLINGIEPDPDIVRVVSSYYNVITVPETGIVLSKYHADLLDAKVGDVITVNGAEVTVMDISEQYVFQVSYVSSDFFDTLPVAIAPRASLMVKTHDNQAFFEQFKHIDGAYYFAFNDVIRGETEDRLIAFDISTYVLNAIAIIMGFMIIFNMMITNLKEYKRSFATMRTLGYQRSSISIANLMNNLFQYVVATALAIPAGMFAAKYTLSSLSTDVQVFPFPNVAIIYFQTAFLVLVFILISHHFAMHDMKRWILPSCIKERE
jgi:putative ABC transport system permease protein